MIETKLMNEARNLYLKLKNLFWESERLEASGRSILIVDMAERRYERRLKLFVAAINKRRKAEEARQA